MEFTIQFLRPWDVVPDDPEYSFNGPASSSAVRQPVPMRLLRAAREFSLAYPGSVLWYGSREAAGGDFIRLGAGATRVTGWPFFIDIEPHALWSHHCLYLVICGDGEIKMFEAEAPPSSMLPLLDFTEDLHADNL